MLEFRFEVQCCDNESSCNGEAANKMKDVEDNFLYIAAGLVECSFKFCCNTLHSPRKEAC